ncbi:MAG: response regulator [Acidobacteriaceae bacterium]|nr:response regulator [Acidobacteriaceae bacterium]
MREPISRTEAAGLPLNVLVVEDEALIAMELRARLSRLGHRVVGVADTGREAIELARLEKPQLVLMDIHLKGDMSGIEAASAINKDGEVPIIYLTAHSDAATVSRAKQTSPFGYLLKPLDERELLIAIEVATQRSRLEQRLRDGERRYAATLASIGDGVVATDVNGMVTFLNPVAEELTGWTLAEASGVPVEQVLTFIDDVANTALENPLQRALRDGETRHLKGETSLLTRNRQLIPIDDSSAPIRDDDGHIVGAVLAFRDARQRRLSENALRIATDQLNRSQRLESLGRLAGGIAHDFNNLLTIINGYSQLLLTEHPLDATQRELVGAILDAGDRAAKLTQQLLAFGKGQLIRAERFRLNDVLSQTHNLLRRIIGEDIRIDLVLSEKVSEIFADPTQVEQVVMNLATNARDAMPLGGILRLESRLTRISAAAARLSPGLKPGTYAQLIVSDTGIGFSEDVQRYIFEPFFTTKSSGRELAENLQTKRPALKTLFLSGYTNDKEAREGFHKGQLAFLSKPFKRNDLLQKINELFSTVH